jgi:hypothetical protein
MRIVFLILLFTFSCFESFSIEGDSIVVNIGKRKKLIIYGESKEDLKDFEKYDLNKIIKQMNQELNDMPEGVKKMVLRDYEGNTYDKISEKQLRRDSLSALRQNQIYASKWQNFINNYYLNFSFGFSVVNRTIRDSYINRPVEPYYLTAQPFYFKTFGSPMIGVSLNRQDVTFRGFHKKIFIKYGVELNWQYIDEEINNFTFYGTQQNPKNASKVDTIYRFVPNEDKKVFIRQDYPYNPNLQTEVKSPIRQSILYANFNVMPTINLYGKNNLQSFSFGLGGYLGTMITGNGKFFYQRKDKPKDTLSENVIPYITKDNPIRYGITVMAGYKLIHVFLQSDINNIFKEDDRRWSQNLTTFGIKIGR